jgi:hypothetical protein
MHGGSVSMAETWSASGNPHVLPFDVSVYAPLTLEPCVVVTLAAGKTLTVNPMGSITANGTASQPIVFKNADGAAAWASVRFIGGTGHLSYMTFENGGDPLNTVPDFSGALDVRSALTAPTAPEGVLFVDHVTVKGSRSQGVRLQTNGGFTADSTALTITGSAAHAITSDANVAGTIPSGSYTGNTFDDILFIDNPGIRWDMTLHERGVPYYSGGTNQSGVTAVGAVGAATAPIVLTIEPGVRWKFKKGTGLLQVDPGGTPSRGVLVARGTAEKPIVFTSDAAAPMAGDWLGIWMGGDDGRNVLDHVRIEFAGKLVGNSGSNSCQSVQQGVTTNGGAIRVYHAPPSTLVSNTEFVASETNAIDRGWRDNSQPSFIGAGTGNTFTGIGQCKETMPRDANGACPVQLPCP